MLRRFHQFWLRLLTPAAKFFLAAGIGPDVITLVGTAGVVAGALIFYPLGQLFWGTVVITAFVFSDMLDGLMARMSGRSSKWGAFLDSTLDRVGDAAVFGGLTVWFLTGGTTHSPGLTSSAVGLVLGCLALYDLVMGSMTSYARARAESLGMTANVGIAERADRLVAVLVATGLSGLGVPYLLELVLVALAVASTVTVVQRMLAVRRQVLEAETAAQEAAPGPAPESAAESAPGSAAESEQS